MFGLISCCCCCCFSRGLESQPGFLTPMTYSLLVCFYEGLALRRTLRNDLIYYVIFSYVFCASKKKNALTAKVPHGWKMVNLKPMKPLKPKKPMMNVTTKCIY